MYKTQKENYFEQHNRYESEFVKNPKDPHFRTEKDDDNDNII